jgi:hypothetical protein
VNISVQVARQRTKLFVGGDLIFRALAITQDGLRSILIVPKIGLSDASFEGLQAFAMWRGVKDNSGPY